MKMPYVRVRNFCNDESNNTTDQRNAVFPYPE